ncbi:MAG: murein L,D-transpeptidase catalytic domain family protein [Bacteroidota bacterium]
MKKIILCFLISLVSSFSFHASAFEPSDGNNTNKENEVDSYIRNIYKQINFKKSTPLDYEVFKMAYNGYMNLRTEGKLNSTKQVLTICDYSRSSTEYRLWVIDLRSKRVLHNTYVAHGSASGAEFATAFSNKNNSHKSSIGFYVTGDTYVGECGVSLRLHGMDHGFNDAAFNRGIVLHGSRYVNGKYIASNKMAGRSFGCPAVPYESLMDIIFTIENGTCLFMYFPQKEYIQTAYWLNKKWDNMPTENIMASLPIHSKADSTASYPASSTTLLK